MANKRTFSGTSSTLTPKANRAKAEKVHAALYQIADAASAMTEMESFYAALHRIVREFNGRPKFLR